MASVTGGGRLDGVLKTLVARLDQQQSLRVGFMAHSTEADGTSVAMIAATQEYGSAKAGIPPRPFFRPMIAAKSPAWGKQLGKILVANDCDAAQGLALLGEVVKGQLQASIKAVTAPPLKPATIKRKGFSKPLIDTGTMLASVESEVS